MWSLLLDGIGSTAEAPLLGLSFLEKKHNNLQLKTKKKHCRLAKSYLQLSLPDVLNNVRHLFLRGVGNGLDPPGVSISLSVK
jgi:hypothetical protein